MIPGSFSLERDWVYTNIISEQFSWNQARASFTRHYQRSDYMDGRRELCGRCAKAKDETTQEYSRRFQTLATQLRYPDGNSQGYTSVSQRIATMATEEDAVSQIEYANVISSAST